MPARDRGVAAAFARVRNEDRRLGPWMMRHHDALMNEIGTDRIEWASPLAVFASLGLTDEHGQSLTRDTASRTWRRVRIAVAAARQAEARTMPRPGEIAPGVRLVPPIGIPSPQRVHAPVPPVVLAAGVPGVAPGGAEEATEHIRSVLDAMGAARVPLPRQPSPSPPAAARRAHDRISDP